MKNCKYYHKHLETIREYIFCLYQLEDCCTGGLLHAITDDGNLTDRDLERGYVDCVEHPELEESEIGKLICKELLKLSIEQRRLVYEPDWAIDAFCGGPTKCDSCYIKNEEFTWWK